ncbi:MAG: COG4315 family predicted lipoprotein [Solirubrobacteraceae bacterium]
MRSYKKLFVPTASVAAGLLIAACGSASNSSNSSASSQSSSSSGSSGSAALVKTAANSAVGGTILVNANGMTLYRLSGEKADKFICTSTVCLQNWHPLIASSARPNGSVGSLTVIKRPNGTMQVAYKGQPLYTFVGDTSPGQDKGQGVKDVGTWDAVTTRAASSASGSSGSPSSGSGGGSGYAY